MIRILLKGLRDKDRRQETDPRLYLTAEAMADELRDWRQACERRRLRNQRAIAAGVLVFVLGVLGAFLNSWYGDLQQNLALRQYTSLKRQTEDLPYRSDSGVAKLLAEARAHEDEGFGVPGTLPRATAALQQAIHINDGLVRCHPLRKALDTTLAQMNWVTQAPVMMARKQRAEEAYTEIERLLAQGQTDAAWEQLHPLQLELAELLHENAQAGQAFEARSQYQLLTARIAERLRDHRDFVPIAELAKLGEQAWEAGTWDSARTALGQARQRLETFLQENETPEELAAREKASVEVLRTIEQERQRQQAEIDQLAAERDRLKDQFLKATQQSVADRDELTKTRAKLLTETGQRSAAEQHVQQQTAQLDTLKREQTALQTKIGRLEEQTVQLSKLRAELSQTKNEAAATMEQLASAQRQLTAGKAKAPAAASNPLPLTSISTDGFAGTRAGQ
ncbi:MAG: hypothetical protein NTY19_32135 [Planctomycetota bacterium]|nr:hypothetical protein [Planctomycetota bacterium]